MTNTEVIWTCIGFGVLTLACCIFVAYALCKAASNPTPHPDEVNSCNGGLTDEEMRENDTNS